ncbi:hypothetical protein [Saccharicrinis fermentans]|nr:hypothetical protein [Saccharicrinis fermentans]
MKQMKHLFENGVIVKASAEEYIIGAMFAAGCIAITSERAVI